MQRNLALLRRENAILRDSLKSLQAPFHASQHSPALPPQPTVQARTWQQQGAQLQK
jgi:hypothetical protein